MTSGWKRRALGDLLQLQNGFAFDSKKFGTTGTPLIRIRDLKRGTETDTCFDGEYDKRYLVKRGDLLIGMDGEFRCHEWKGPEALLNQRVCRLQGFSGDLLPRFVLYGINKYLKDIEDVTAFATVKHLSSKQILGVDFPAPSIEEQHRIVALLDEAFAGIATAKANAEKSLRNSQEIFETHLQSSFSRRDDWSKKTLGEIADFRNGINFTKASKGRQVRVLGVKDFQNHFHAPDTGLDRVTIDGNLDTSDFLQTGDIVFVRSNGNPELIGRSLVIEGMSEETAHSGFTIRGRPRSKEVLPQYLGHFLKSSAVRRQMVDSGTGTNIKSLNQGTLSRLVVPYPPRAEQLNIVDRLEEVQAETRHLASLYTRKLSALDELKQSLLHQAFSGQLT